MRGDSAVRLDGLSGGLLGSDELDYRIRGKLIASNLEVTEAGGARVVAEPDAPAAFNPARAASFVPGTRHRLTVTGTDLAGRPVALASAFWLRRQRDGGATQGAQARTGCGNDRPGRVRARARCGGRNGDREVHLERPRGRR